MEDYENEAWTPGESYGDDGDGSRRGNGRWNGGRKHGKGRGRWNDDGGNGRHGGENRKPYDGNRGNNRPWSKGNGGNGNGGYQGKKRNERYRRGPSCGGKMLTVEFSPALISALHEIAEEDCLASLYQVVRRACYAYVKERKGDMVSPEILQEDSDSSSDS